jgi:hypothetical protein
MGGPKMKKIVLLGIFVLWFVSAIGVSLGTENIQVYGLNNCEKIYISQIGDFTAKPNYIFLVTGYRIEYQGSNSVSIDPSSLSIQLGGAQYSSSGATYNLDKIGKTYLSSLKLVGGGSTEGYIAYEIPIDMKNSDFKLVYSGFEDVTPNYQCS